MKLSCLKSLLLCALYTNLSHLTTNLFLYVLFCVIPVCYDVRLSHLNKEYLLTHFTPNIVYTGVLRDGTEWRRVHVPQPERLAQLDERRSSGDVYWPDEFSDESSTQWHDSTVWRPRTTAAVPVRSVMQAACMLHTPDSPSSTPNCPTSPPACSLHAGCMSVVKCALNEHAHSRHILYYGIFYRRVLFISTALQLQPIKWSARTYQRGKLAVVGH